MEVFEPTEIMLEGLRVTDMRYLLSHMGKLQTGLRKDLLKRLLPGARGPEIIAAVRELHESRPARRSGTSLSPGPGLGQKRLTEENKRLKKRLQNREAQLLKLTNDLAQASKERDALKQDLMKI